VTRDPLIVELNYFEEINYIASATRKGSHPALSLISECQQFILPFAEFYRD
jgi:hypothetical protein